MRVGVRIGWGALGAVLALGCGDDGGEAADDTGCVGPKCDDPNEDTGGTGGTDDGGTGTGTGGGTDEVDEACWARRTEAFNPNRIGFTLDALRWSCADIDDRPADERGQEYCEYFAIVQVPYETEPSILGMLLGPDFTDGHTPFGLELDADQIAALEAQPDAVAGACVFTSWNADIVNPNGCEGMCTPEQDIVGVPFDEQVFRMKYDPNTNEAAQALVYDCMDWIAPEGDPEDPDDPLHDAFFRACQLDADINGTQDRKSDTIICAAAVRLAECGCYLPYGLEFPEGLAPADELGFPLGGWEAIDQLPAGCRYEEIVADNRNVVVCDLTAAEVVQNASELKTYCQQTYADDVVVHIPVPAADVTCEPDPELETYADTCSETPWVLQP